MSTMCTSVHMSIQSVMSVYVRSMCMPCMVCMHRWNLFLAKHRFQTCVVHGTLAQSGAQTINTLLKHTNIIFNYSKRGSACNR